MIVFMVLWKVEELTEIKLMPTARRVIIEPIEPLDHVHRHPIQLRQQCTPRSLNTQEPCEAHR